MLGKMSVGVRRMTTGAAMRISSAKNDKCVRSVQSKLDDPHMVLALLVAVIGPRLTISSTGLAW